MSCTKRIKVVSGTRRIEEGVFGKKTVPREDWKGEPMVVVLCLR